MITCGAHDLKSLPLLTEPRHSRDHLWSHCARIHQGGEALERIRLDRFCFAAMLGGPGRRTLFMLVADWRGPEHVNEVVAARTGRVFVAEAPAPGVGWP